MEKELQIIVEKLKKAQTLKEEKDILKYVAELNELWEKNSEKMKENAKKDGYYPPVNPSK
jgi:thiamine biosynthesis lipoprotein ApbE|tara:strand:+ start:772 stop:951 length:180 start_codon:yes stop_codon:yes gene_type:complete